jgi:hypothetical protein
LPWLAHSIPSRMEMETTENIWPPDSKYME